MEFGMPVLLGREEPEETVRLCRDLGLSFVELNMNLPQYQAEDLERTEMLQRIATEYGIYFTVHLDENLDPWDFNPAVAAAWLDTAERAVRAASALKAPVVNLHLSQGVYFTLPEGRVHLYERYLEGYLRRTEEFRDRVARLAGGVTVCVENTGGFLPFQMQALELLLQSPVFGLTWDIGHSHTAGERDETFFLGHRTRLKHFHIHDGAGKRDHLPLGSGEIDLYGRLSLARECGGRCVVEVKTPETLERSVSWLRANGWM